jgi:hypothetical protein
MKKILKFICVKETKLSGARDTTKVGDEFYADLNQWKSSNWLTLYDEPVFEGISRYTTALLGTVRLLYANL